MAAPSSTLEARPAPADYEQYGLLDVTADQTAFELLEEAIPVQQPEAVLTQAQQRHRGPLGRLANNASIHIGTRVQNTLNGVVDSMPNSLGRINPRLRRAALVVMGATAAVTALKYMGGTGGAEHHFASSADMLSYGGNGGSGNHLHYQLAADTHQIHVGGDTNVTVHADQTPIDTDSANIYGPKHTDQIQYSYAGSKPNVTPDANHDLHFVDKGNDGVRIQLQDMKPGGTTINGHNITHAQLQDMRVVETVNVNGHEQTIVAQMDGKHLDVHGDYANYIENRDFDTLRVVVPGKDSYHMTSLSTVVGNHHDYTTTQLHDIANHYGVSVPNEPPAAHEYVGAPSGTESQTTITGGHGFNVAPNQHDITVGEPQNVLTPYGRHNFLIHAPDAITFQNGHMVIDPNDIASINKGLRDHGLSATYHYDTNGNIDQITFHNLGTDPTDMHLPPGYGIDFNKANHNLVITLPDGRTTNVHVPDTAYDVTTGYINFDQVQPLIKSKLASADGVTILWHGHTAVLEQPAGFSGGTGGTQTPNPAVTVTPPPKTKIVYRNHEDNDDWLWGLGGALVGGLVVGGIVAAASRRRDDDHHDEETTIINEGDEGDGRGRHRWTGWLRRPDGTMRILPQRRGLTETADPETGLHDATVPPAERAARTARADALNVAHSALLLPLDGPARRANLVLIQDLRSNRLDTEADDTHENSQEVIHRYSDRVLDVLDGEDPNFNGAAAMRQHLEALGIPMGEAEFRQAGDHVVIEGNRADIKRIARQLAVQFQNVPDPDSFLSNDDSLEHFERLAGEDGALPRYEAHMRLPEAEREAGEVTTMQETIDQAVNGILQNLAAGNEGRVPEVLQKMNLNTLVTYNTAEHRIEYTPDNHETRLVIARRLMGIVNNARAVQEEPEVTAAEEAHVVPGTPHSAAPDEA